MNCVKVELEAIKKSFIMPIFSACSLGLLLSSPLWLPASLSVLREASAVAFGPKGLFVVCNVIIMVLVGESKRSKPSPQADVHEERAERNKSSGEENGVEERVRREEALRGEDGAEEIGERGLEELNRRAEDFIARVNRQRKLEARLLDCHG